MRSLLVVLALLGCERAHGPEVDCPAEVGKLRAFLSTMKRDRNHYADLALYEKPGVSAMPSAPRLLVEVTPARISVANRGVERAELWGALEAARGDFADPRRVVLAIDQATTWDRIEPVLETLGAVGFTTVELILTTPAAPPPRTPIDDAFDAVEARDDPSTRASAFAKVVGEEAKRCPALVALFGGAVTSGDVGAHIATGAPEALLACDCAVAPATMRSIAWRTLGNPRPIGILALQLDRTAGSPTFPPRATWADASKQLEPGRIWFGRR